MKVSWIVSQSLICHNDIGVKYSDFDSTVVEKYIKDEFKITSVYDLISYLL